MQRSFLIVISVIVFCTLKIWAVQISGSVYLYGRPNHTGTSIVFTAVSPSARTDSTHADSSGHFALALQPGVYDVEFVHAGFAAVRFPNELLLFDRTLDSLMLYPPLSGNISGDIGPGEFDVVDTIRAIQATNILPGTKLYFRGSIPLLVLDRITATGTEQDSILFTHRFNHPDSLWGGIHSKNNPNLPGVFRYCAIEYAYVVRRSSNIDYQGALSGLYSTFILEHVGFCRSSTVGLSLTYSSANIDSCLFEGNIAGYYGMTGAFYSTTSTATISHCNFLNNISDNTGAAASLYNNQATSFLHCNFVHNGSTQNNPHAIDLSGTGNAGFVDCEFIGNSSPEEYGGSVIEVNPSGNIVIDHCLIASDLRGYDTFSGIVEIGNYGSTSGSVIIERSTIISLSSLSYGERCIATNPSARLTLNSCVLYSKSYFFPIVCYANVTPNIAYNCILGGDSIQSYETPPPGLGIVALTNANGDSCDTYYNIFRDPMFVDTANGDYHLRAGSPCIDAGDPSLAHDPDGTVADLGAFYFDQADVPNHERTVTSQYRLAQNYPNPFNAQTRIAFDLPKAEIVRLDVFDLLGRKVMTLSSGPLQSGHHETMFDGQNLASGVYVYRLQAGDFMQAKKLTLIK